MRKFKNKTIKELFENKTDQIYFSHIISAIIFLDKSDRDHEAFEIIREIESINKEDYIRLLIEDLIQRNFKVKPDLLYNSLWYSTVNDIPHRKILLNLLSNHEKKNNFINYLEKLIEDESEVGYKNMSNFVKNLKK